MILTIFITTMPSRSENLAELIEELGATDWTMELFPHLLGEIRRWTKGEVEIVAYLTPPYDKVEDGLSYGGKRNVLLDIARGEYVAAIDDDDSVHPEYLPRILKALESKPDVVGFKVACYGYANNCKSPEIMEPADIHTKYDGWKNNLDGFTYVRYPHHLAPTKREHAFAIKYRGHYGEDHDYSVRMQASGRLKKIEYIDEFLYTYLFNAKKKPGQ